MPTPARQDINISISKMTPIFTLTLLLEAVSIIHSDDELSSCGPTIFVTSCHQPSSITIIMFANLVTAQLPLLNECFNRKLLPLPPSRLSLKFVIFLLLAGDVSLNPDPSGSNDRIKIATMHVRSIKQKTPPFSKCVTSKNLDIMWQ